MLPNNVESITFYIVPEHMMPHTSDGLFYGIVGFDLFQEYQMEKNINHISIEIPAMDDSFLKNIMLKAITLKYRKAPLLERGSFYKENNLSNKRLSNNTNVITIGHLWRFYLPKKGRV